MRVAHQAMMTSQAPGRRVKETVALLQIKPEQNSFVSQNPKMLDFPLYGSYHIPINNLNHDDCIFWGHTRLQRGTDGRSKGSRHLLENYFSNVRQW